MTYNYIIIDDLCDQDERTSEEKLRAVKAWFEHAEFGKRRVALTRLVDCPQFWEWYIGMRFKPSRRTGIVVKGAFTHLLHLSLAQDWYYHYQVMPKVFIPIIKECQFEGPKLHEIHYL